MGLTWGAPADAWTVGHQTLEGDTEYVKTNAPEANLYAQTIALGKTFLGRLPSQEEFVAALSGALSGGASATAPFWQTLAAKDVENASKPSAETQSAIDQVNSLQARAAVAQAQAQLSYSQQLASDASVPPAAAGPSLIDSIGGRPIGAVTPVDSAAPKPNYFMYFLLVGGVLGYMIFFHKR